MRLINQHLITLNPLTLIFFWGLSIEPSIPFGSNVNSYLPSFPRMSFWKTLSALAKNILMP